jgi:xanthine dehydrogenase accessory factor
MNIFALIVECLESGKEGMLATVIKRVGSAPRDVGAKMFVDEDGRIAGTVGGGRLEAEVYREARAIMKKGLTKVLAVSMDARKVDEQDMLCGGRVEILVEPVAAKHLDVYRRIQSCQEKRERAVIVTDFRAHSAKALVDESLNMVGDVLDSRTVNHCEEVFHQKHPVLLDGVLFDPVRISFPLYVFGAGHVAQFVSKVARLVDFHITVIDDREEFANRERFPEADVCIVGSFRDTLKCLDFTGTEYAVILTRSHGRDAEVLEECLKKPVRYLGMMGSKRKVRVIFDHMREKGFDEKSIGRVHAPIGISINAETPQEIAVSIVAELVSVRNGKEVALT